MTNHVMLVLLLLLALTIAAVQCQSNSSLATAVVNTKILTLISYENTQIYIYGALANDNEFKDSPERWIFYYVPVAIIPIERFYDESISSKWMWSVEDRIKVKILLGNQIITDKAREAIKKKYSEKHNQFSAKWDVSPLMIDSLTAYIVEIGSGESAPGVQPYHVVHPHGLTVTATFVCSQERVSQEVLKRIFHNEYEIRVAFVFAGFRQVTTNLVFMSAQTVKTAFTKTVADSGDDKAEYIHRSQVNKFVQNYLSNLQLMVYSEGGKTENSAPEFGAGELLQHFSHLFTQGILNSQLVDVDDSTLFQQIWSRDDLNPDVLTHELNKAFKYDEEESQKYDDKEKYFSFDRSSSSFTSVSSSVGVSLFDVGIGISANAAKENEQKYGKAGKSVVSLQDLRNAFHRKDTHVEWTGKKLTVKKFKVYKLSDLKNEFRASFLAKQLTAERVNGGILRILGYYEYQSQFYKSSDKFPYFPGMVFLYSGNEDPPLPWLVCNGTAVPRTRFPQLFESIGTKYGAGDGKETFLLPDFRSRLPLGIDAGKVHSEMAQVVGQVGGEAWRVLTISELATHTHDPGNLTVSQAGVNHKHNVHDPGHKHHIDEDFFATIDGIKENDKKGPRMGYGETKPGYYHFRISDTHDTVLDEHSHALSNDFTNIKVKSGGEHNHSMLGSTFTTGSNKRMNLIGPYQVLRFIIYGGKIF
jgi:microcystin-dependent protein